MVCLIINGQDLPHQRELVKNIFILWNSKCTITVLNNCMRTSGIKTCNDSSFFISTNWKLYSKALEYADLHGEETVWDLYCGIGTISLFLAQKAKFVRGVEIVPAAIEDAKRNAQINHIENVEFFVGKAEEVLPREYEKNGVYADVIVVDPPRKGCDEMFLKQFLRCSPNEWFM